MTLRRVAQQLIASAVLLIALGDGATAGEPEDYRVDGDLELPGDVVVTGGTAATREFDAPRDVKAISRKRLQETQASSIKQALEDVPGVHMQITNRGAGTPLIRGLFGPQNLLVVDGVRFNLATFRTGPNQYLSLFDPQALQRIEVLRGPSSVFYGNGAMGGVVHLVTEPLKIPGGRLSVAPTGLARLSSADTSILVSAAADLSVRGFGLQAGVTVQQLGELRSGGGDIVPASNFRRVFWRLKAGYAAREWSLTAAYFGGAVGPGGRVDRLGRGEVRFYENLDQFTYLKFDWRPKDSPIEHFRVAVGYHGLAETVERFNCRTDDDGIVVDVAGCGARAVSQVVRTRLNDDAVHGVNADMKLTFRLLDGRLRLSWGGEVGYDTVADSTRVDGRVENAFEPEVKPRGNLSTGSSYLETGAFIGAMAVPLSLEKGKYQLQLRAGARVSYFEASAEDVPGLGLVTYDFVGVVGSGGVQFLMADTLNIFANFVQGFRSPNLQETTVLGDTGNFFEVPNPDLGPERSDTIEVGARVNLGPVKASATFFYSMLENAIDRAPATYNGASTVDDKEVRARVNSSSGTYLGVEGEVTVAFAERFTLGASVTWVQGELEDGDGNVDFARRIPPVFGTARLRYDHPRWSAYAEVYTQWAAPQDRLGPGDKRDLRICQTEPYSGVFQDPCDGTPAWGHVGLRAGMRPVDLLRIDLQIANATDIRYRTHGSGFDAAGIDVRLSLSLGL